MSIGIMKREKQVFGQERFPRLLLYSLEKAADVLIRGSKHIITQGSLGKSQRVLIACIFSFSFFLATSQKANFWAPQ